MLIDVLQIFKYYNIVIQGAVHFIFIKTMEK